MRVPSCIGIGCGVRIRKRSSGGVMRSRLAVSAKKANTRSRGSGRLIDVLRTWSVTLPIVISLVAPLFSRLSSFLAVEYRPRLARCETAAQSVLYFLTIVEKLDQ